MHSAYPSSIDLRVIALPLVSLGLALLLTGGVSLSLSEESLSLDELLDELADKTPTLEMTVSYKQTATSLTAKTHSLLFSTIYNNEV